MLSESELLARIEVMDFHMQCMAEKIVKLNRYIVELKRTSESDRSASWAFHCALAEKLQGLTHDDIINTMPKLR